MKKCDNYAGLSVRTSVYYLGLDWTENKQTRHCPSTVYDGTFPKGRQNSRWDRPFLKLQNCERVGRGIAVSKQRIICRFENKALGFKIADGSVRIFLLNFQFFSFLIEFLCCLSAFVSHVSPRFHFPTIHA